MSRFSKRKILIPLLVLAAIIPVVAADVIYYYSGVVNVYSTSSPITISVGPNGVQKLPSPSAGYYIYVTALKRSTFTANVNITNSSYDYFYKAVTLTVSTTVNLFVTNVSYTYTSTNPIDNAWIVIYSSSGTYKGEFQVISSGKATTPSTIITLSADTYYISILIQPNTPLPPPSSSSIATFSIYLGDNVVTPSAVPLPPT